MTSSVTKGDAAQCVIAFKDQNFFRAFLSGRKSCGQSGRTSADDKAFDVFFLHKSTNIVKN